MAVLTITAANVFANPGTTKLTVTAGEAVTQGQLVYLQASDGLYYKSRANAAATAKLDGIVLSAGSPGQPIVIAKVTNEEFCGTIDLGATLAVGMVYVVSPSTAGGINPITDIGTGDYVVVLGAASSADDLVIGKIDPAVQSAEVYV